MNDDEARNDDEKTPEIFEKVPTYGSVGARYLVLFALCAASSSAYLSRNSLAVTESTIRAELGLSDQLMGWILSAFFCSYALFQLPTGWLGDRLGTRRSLPLCSSGWSLATAGLALTTAWPLLLVWRFCNGAAQAGLFPCCTKTIANWFPRREIGLANGFLGASMAIGGAAAGYVTGLLLETWGWSWQAIFLLYSLPGILWAAAFWICFRDTPEEYARPEPALVDPLGPSFDKIANTTDNTKTRPEPPPWLAMLTSPAMFWIAGQQFFRGAAFIFFASWFATYLQETRGVTPGQSGFFTMLPLLGNVLGSLLGGHSSDLLLEGTRSRWLARSGLAGGSLALCGALVFGAYFVADPWLAVLLISAGSLFSAVAGPCAYSITIDMGGKHVATVFSLMNMSGNVGAALFPLVVPLLKDWSGSWDSVLLLFVGIYFCGSLCWFFLQPEGTIFSQSPYGTAPAETNT